MSATDSPTTVSPGRPSPGPRLGDSDLFGESLLADAELAQALGQTIAEALDLTRWDQGGQLESLIQTITKTVGMSVREEQRISQVIRDQVLSRLREFPSAPDLAGVYPVPESVLRDYRRQILLAGQLTAVDGVSTGHEGLGTLLVCMGIGLVRYDGQVHSWRSTFLRHDYHVKAGDPLQEVKKVLNRRAERSEGGATPGRDRLSSLLRRGFMAAAERKALLERTQTRWRMGHGTPAPMELLTGSGSMELIDTILPVLEKLLLDETRWVFLPDSLSDQALLTLAGGLLPNEVGIFQKARASLEAMIERGTYEATRKRRVQEFAARAGEAMVIGGFRATAYAPARLFVAHAERAVEAGILALADAALQPHRGWPIVLELAHHVAQSGLNVEGFAGLVESAYVKARGSHLFTPGRLVND